ncbi:ABC transporter permease [Nocardioides jiangxiensis]|uniref:ABC transporter permease n=1 Tax=Nocardioides jiangxiensis TaxID=3064524 RepID=A0ABT9AYC6_9ACTN|nr:ABC transporter permease [Nocardioides sp. WY-20]MDO7867489.1 ABC transporter permease [Nocardioides sp. WY-20]
MSTTDYASLPLVDPAGGSGLIEVRKHRYLLKLLVRRELQARYSGSALGMAWSYVNPLSQLFIYWGVMGKIMGMSGRTENFAIHVFVGLVTVHFFTETFNAGTRSIVRNKAFVRKMALPLELFPVSSMLVSAVGMVPELIILTVICLFCGWHPDMTGVIAFFLGAGIMAAAGTGLALVFSVANVFFRDFGQLVGILVNYVRFGVPMMYPYTRVAHIHLVEVYLANPLAEAVLLMQRAFWAGTTRGDIHKIEQQHFPSHLLERGAVALAVSIAILLIGQLVFSKFENKVPERV